MSQKEVNLYGALSISAYIAIFAYAFPKLTTHAAFNGDLCLRTVSEANYTFFPEFLNRMFCLANITFQSFWTEPGPKLLANQFAYFIPVYTAMVSFESFRQSSTLVRQGGYFLLLSQAISSGGTLPLYFACLAWQEYQGSRRQRTIPAEEMWTIWLSTTFGCLIPVYLCERTSMSFHTITVFQCFPYFVIGLNHWLPPLLRPLARGTCERYPLYGLMATLVFFAIRMQHMQNTSGLSWSEIYLPRLSSINLVDDAHRLGILDYFFTVVSASLYTMLALARSEVSFRIKIILFISACLVARFTGVGGVLTILWGASQCLLSKARPKM